MPKIVMGDFVDQYSSQLLTVCLLEKTRCYVKLATARIGRVNIGVVLRQQRAFLLATAFYHPPAAKAPLSVEAVPPDWDRSV